MHNGERDVRSQLLPGGRAVSVARFLALLPSYRREYVRQVAHLGHPRFCDPLPVAKNSSCIDFFTTGRSSSLNMPSAGTFPSSLGSTLCRPPPYTRPSPKTTSGEIAFNHVQTFLASSGLASKA